LLSVNEAQVRLLSRFSPVSLEDIPIPQALGRVLAEDVASEIDLPFFPNSSMDGFAVKADDLELASKENPVSLRVVADIPAGSPSDVKILQGQSARIMTGAQVPEGASAVVPVEDTDFNDRQAGVQAPAQVQIYRSVRFGENVRSKGMNVRAGEIVMRSGIRLRPQDIGFLAMLGIKNVPVRRLPRVGIFSTGDELLPVEEPLAAGKIHDSNTYTLVSLVKQNGAKPINLGIVSDNVDEVEACLDRAVAEQVDIIISSAGVSVGAFDFVRNVIEAKGVLEFWRVNMRPGKPLAFGSYRDVPFFGLPGNPVSTYVGFIIFVRPALLKLLAVDHWQPRYQKAKLLEDVHSDGRESYLRAVVNWQEGDYVVSLTGHQDSGNLRSLVQANAFLIVPSEVKSLPTGSKVDVWLLDEIN
jgi:molybdopterin molybdotransferase